jgi:hypothetical protein
MALTENTRRNLFGLNALSAWLGFGFSFIIELLDLEPYTSPASSLYGGHAAGLPGAFNRIVDLLSYFTIWSQIVVGVVMTLLFLNPGRDGRIFRVFRIDSVLMITVTGIVYNLLIGPNFPPQGLNVYSSFLEHTLTPLLTVIVFVLAGPRGWFTRKTVVAGLYLPIAYIFYALIRGAIIHQYPYDFMDVVTYGYMSVIITVLVILVAALIFLVGFWALDYRLNRSAASRDASPVN